MTKKSHDSNKLSEEQLIAMSKRLKGDADQLLDSSDLLSMLSHHGEPKLVGSYPAGLMVHGDIDLHVVRNKKFNKSEVLKILAHIVARTPFTQSGYYHCHWLNSGKNPNLPRGYYIGLKTMYRDREWKIDLWFVSSAEQQRQEERLNICNIQLSHAQRITILCLKQYRNDADIKVSGQKVYEAVLINGVTTIAGFRKWMKKYL